MTAATVEMQVEIENLFREQVQSWPRLRKGIEGLGHAKTRRMRMGWFDVYARHIPHRIGSTTAAVDAKSVQNRRCFLCAENLDPEEKGIAFADFTIYLNPFPIVERHLTIVHNKHREQRIAGQVGNLLDMAQALPGYFSIYNGPECGASAPDHLHFQAGRRDLFPIEKDTAGMRGPVVEGYDRNVFLFRSTDRSYLIHEIDRAMEWLSSVTDKAPEPMINIAVFHEPQQGWTVYLFPRGKHRPEVFHTGELTVSPASIDLCGIFVVPVERDFERISADDIARIFREVTLPKDQFDFVAARLLEG